MASILAVGALFTSRPSNLGFLLPVMLGLLVIAAAVAAWSFWRWKKSSDVHSDFQPDLQTPYVQVNNRHSAVLPLQAGSLSLGASLGAAQSASKIAPVEEPAAHASVPAQAHDLAAEPARLPAKEEERKHVIAPRFIAPPPSAKPSVNDFSTLRTRVAPSAQASAFQRVAKAPAAPVRDEAATYATTVPQRQDQVSHANRVAPVEPHEDMWPQPRGPVTRIAPEALVSSPSDQDAAPQSPAILDSEPPAEQPLLAGETPAVASAPIPASDSVVEASAPSVTPYPQAEAFASQPSLFAPEPETAVPSALPVNAAGGEVDLAALLFEDLDLPPDWEIKADSASAAPEPEMPVTSAPEAEPAAPPSTLALEDIYHIVAGPSAESSFAESQSSGVSAESESVAGSLPAGQPEPAPESWFSTEPEPASEPVAIHAQDQVADAPAFEAPMEASAPAEPAAALVPAAPPERDEPVAAAPLWPEARSLPAVPFFAAPPLPQIPVRPEAPAPRAVRGGYVALGARYPQCHRLSLGIPITVRGLVWRDETLTEDTWTLTVLPNGAIINLASVVAADEELILVNNKTGEQVGCRVVAMKNAEASRKQVEVEFTQPAPRFWRVTFPPADWSPSQRKRPGSSSSPSRDDVPEIIPS